MLQHWVRSYAVAMPWVLSAYGIIWGFADLHTFKLHLRPKLDIDIIRNFK